MRTLLLFCSAGELAVGCAHQRTSILANFLIICYKITMPNYKRFYIPNSIVFITIVTYERQPILIENIELIRTALKTSPYKYEIIAGCVLKDHIHLIIKPENINELSKIISSFKYTFSHSLKCSNDIKDSILKRREKGIWQRRFYDHIIRDENDFNRHLDYIHYNPMKHYSIVPKDWNYSSFQKFVKLGYYESNWCNFDDVNKINNENWE